MSTKIEDFADLDNDLETKEDDVDLDVDELDGTMFETNGKLTETAEDLLEIDTLGDPDNCGICGQTLVVARMLHCLHVFCEQCLDKKLIGDGAGDAGTPDTAINCPTCGYETKVGIKKLSALPLDVTKTNRNDEINSQNNLHCTCCTAKELAKSRCSTCHNLLCNSCDSAHHYMRCFESHKVVPLDELRKEGIKINFSKPLSCDMHKGENLLYYCNTCMEAICSDCMKGEHSEHNCESIYDSEMKVRLDLQQLVNENADKLEELTRMSGELDNNLEELAHQRFAARDLIKETYQSYKAVLEKCRDEQLNKLNKIYRERELLIMKENDEVGKAIGNLRDAYLYASRFLETSTVNEIMYLRKTVMNRLIELNKSSVKINEDFQIEFRSDFDKFETLVKKEFGQLVTEEENSLCVSSVQPSRESSPLTKLPNLRSTMNGISNASATIVGGDGDATVNAPIPNGSPISLQSSFDGDLGSGSGGSGFTLAQTPPLPTVNSASAMTGFNSIAEYNIAQLATLAESAHSPTASPTPSFTLVDFLSSDTAIKNLASLAKLTAGKCPSLSLTLFLNAKKNQTVPKGMIMSFVLDAADNTLPPNADTLIGRSTSPVSLNLSNTLMNGFGGVSSSTSPLLSTPDDIMTDPLGAIIPSSNSVSSLHTRSNKVSPMQIRSKFGQLGPNKGQFNSPHGFCLGLDEDIIVADTNNHRIQVFDKNGQFKFQFGTSGKDEGQLWYPRKVAVMRQTGKYVVCDRGNERSRMQIFTKNGHFLKKIAIRYIDIVAGLAVTGTGEIVAVDSVSPTVFIIGESGDLIRWFDCSDYMREPSDIAIHGTEFYVCDFKGHNVVVFNEKGHFLRRIGSESITNFPNGIDISDAGDILIGDSHGNRFHVAVFSREGALISEFECPYVKVSRCCGLKITSEGYVVTLAKNNHHVLVLNTLYIL